MVDTKEVSQFTSIVGLAFLRIEGPGGGMLNSFSNEALKVTPTNVEFFAK